jgi:hypothetical protein
VQRHILDILCYVLGDTGERVSVPGALAGRPGRAGGR